jgi:hypothetical protein
MQLVVERQHFADETRPEPERRSKAILRRGTRGTTHQDVTVELAEKRRTAEALVNPRIELVTRDDVRPPRIAERRTKELRRGGRWHDDGAVGTRGWTGRGGLDDGPPEGAEIGDAQERKATGADHLNAGG